MSFLEKLDLTGKTAVVTGGAMGLGQAMAQALAEAGAALVIADINEDLGQQSANTIAAEFSVPAAFVRLDVTSEDSTIAATAKIESEIAPIDVLVNNAGIVRHQPLVDVSLADWRTVTAVNLDGVFLMSREVGRRMLARGSGSIVNVSSMSGIVANVPQAQASYNASKAAVIMLTKSCAAEWATGGVRVNTIAPGYMQTALTRPFFDAGGEQVETWMAMTPMGRPGSPDELGAAAVFLASDASSFMTGAVLNIDGGYTAV